MGNAAGRYSPRCLLNRLTEAEYKSNFELLKEDLQKVLEKEGMEKQERKYICSLDMRYFGQEYTISIDIPENIGYSKDYIENQFNSIYERWDAKGQKRLRSLNNCQDILTECSMI